jgi:aspartyl-tRNA(Asn)/glutamyl-tRNA(Gln) amidotransferase subunit A
LSDAIFDGVPIQRRSTRISPYPALTPLNVLARALESGAVSSRVLVETCLARIDDSAGEGVRTFPFGAYDRALADADTQDRARRDSRAASPFAGIPISLKDNVDQAGEVTRAGTVLFADDPPAKNDAQVAARLRAAGFVVIGRTNMTELAYSGLGMNPHYGTPDNPRSTDVKRIPGGSSSGAAVSVAKGMAYAALGTDTGGSCRIPAAFCGLAGFKPTGRRVPREGVFALSTTLDCVGSLASSATDCAIMDAVMAGEASLIPQSVSLGVLRLAALTGLVLENMEAEVAAAYHAALERLRKVGVQIEPVAIDALHEVSRINANGGFSAAELYAFIGPRLAQNTGLIDPRVLRRLAVGVNITPETYAAMQQIRARLIAKVAETLDRFDAVLMPTTPIVAPRFDDLIQDDTAYSQANALALRNPSIANILDRPAITLPCEANGALPVGVTLMGRTNEDRLLLAVAIALEGSLTN